MNPTYLTGFFNLGMATGLGEGKNSQSKPVKLRLRTDRMSRPARVSGLVYIYIYIYIYKLTFIKPVDDINI